MSTSTIVRLGAGLLLISGCKGGEKLPTVPVTGTVTYKGSPLAGATVTFVAKQQDARGASGLTDSQGQFKLSTYMGGSSTVSGALPGDYLVSISKRENLTERLRASVAGGGNADGGKILEESANQQGAPAAPAGGPPGRAAPPPEMRRAGGMQGKSEIPEKYETASNSGLTATVKPSGNEPLKFELAD